MSLPTTIHVPTQGPQPPVSQPTLAPFGNLEETDGYKWLLAWGVLIAILLGLNTTKIGHAILYYAMGVLLFFLIVTNAAFIRDALSPFNTINFSSSGNAPQGAAAASSGERDTSAGAAGGSSTGVGGTA